MNPSALYRAQLLVLSNGGDLVLKENGIKLLVIECSLTQLSRSGRRKRSRRGVQRAVPTRGRIA